MKNVVVVIDTKNIMYCLGKTFDAHKLDYSKYMQKAVGENDILLRGIAYIAQEPDATRPFVSLLSHVGLDSKFKPPVARGPTQEERWFKRVGCDVMLTVDVMTLVQSGKVDKLIIGSSEESLVDLINAVKPVGVHTTVFACSIPRELREAADSIVEIDESMLYSAKKE